VTSLEVAPERRGFDDSGPERERGPKLSVALEFSEQARKLMASVIREPGEVWISDGEGGKFSECIRGKSVPKGERTDKFGVASSPHTE
jgi:hypothetical protein